MTPSELTARVTRDTCALGAALTAPAAWLGGIDGAVGALAGAALGIGNFRWLAARVQAAAGHAAAAPALWSVGAGLRLAALAVVAAVVLTSGHVHPVGLVAGLTALPCALVINGLRDARGEG
jgi:ATP synthase I subunit